MSQPTEKASKQTITAYQAFALIYSTILGVGILSLPRDMAETVGNDMVWVIIMSGLIVGVLLYFITWLCQRFPRQTMVQFFPQILGSEKNPKVGRILSIPFFILIGSFWLISVASVARIFGEAVVTSVLINTPIEVIMITLILTGAIAAGSDLGIIAKLNEFLFPFTLLPFFFMLIAMVQKGSMTHILPLLQLDWSMVFKGVFSATYSYAGYKVALMFAGFYQQPEKALKSHTYAVAAVIFSYWYICLTTLSVFGTSELKKVVYPVLEVVKVIHMPALVFDRLESGILAIWLLAVFTSIINLHASLVQMVIEYFQLKEKTRRWIAFAFVPIAYGLGTIPKNYEEVSVYTGWIGLYGNTIALIVSVLLLVLAVIRRKKGGARHENSSHP